VKITLLLYYCDGRFQEIVPLNAGNVLVIEDNEPASIWLGLINQALNNSPQDQTDNFQFHPSHSPNSSQDTKSASMTSSSHHPKTSSGGNSLIFQGPSLKSFSKAFMAHDRKHLKVCNCPVEMTRKSYRDACFAPFSCKVLKKHQNGTFIFNNFKIYSCQLFFSVFIEIIY
jgi:hypothetical protein